LFLLRITEAFSMAYIMRKKPVTGNDCHSAVRCQIDGTEAINDMYRSRLIWVVKGHEGEEIGDKKRF